MLLFSRFSTVLFMPRSRNRSSRQRSLSRPRTRPWTRQLRSAYRQEPISSFILTMGSVHAVLGGMGDRTGLLLLGLGGIGLALVLRWWLLRPRRWTEPAAPVRYLPPAPPSLPPLSVSQRQMPD